jgi:hypothetical protein
MELELGHGLSWAPKDKIQHLRALSLAQADVFPVDLPQDLYPLQEHLLCRTLHKKLEIKSAEPAKLNPK